MPRPIQTPDVGIELQQEFGIKGRLDLRVDETIVPVRQIGGARGAGSFQGYFSMELGVSNPGAGTQQSTVNPYNLITEFVTPAATPPSSGTHRVWYLGVSAFSSTPANITDLVGLLEFFPIDPEFQAPFTQLDICVFHAVQADFTTVVGTGGEAWAMPAAKSASWPVPMMMVPGSLFTVRQLATAAVDTFAQALFWCGALGTRPPGA